MRKGANAPLARIRVTFAGGAAVRRQRRRPRRRPRRASPDPGEEIIDTVAEVRANDIVLQSPTKVVLTANVTVQAGHEHRPGRGAGTLDQSKVMIPSDPGEEPYSRRDALAEPRDAPRLAVRACGDRSSSACRSRGSCTSGFSFSLLAESEQKIVRHIGLGGLDSLFALVAWGIGGHEGATRSPATVGAGRKKLVLQSADAVAR